MIRPVPLILCIALAAGCSSKRTVDDMDTRVDAIEARMHTQEKVLRDLSEEVERMKARDKRRMDKLAKWQKRRRDRAQADQGVSAEDAEELIEAFEEEEPAPAPQ